MSNIKKGTRVKLIHPPGTRVPFGAIGTAEEKPNAAGLFWAEFPQGGMRALVSEVEVVD